MKYRENFYNSTPNHGIIPKKKGFGCKCNCTQKMVMSFRIGLRKKWDIFVLMLALYNSLMIPLEQSFNPAWRLEQYS